MRRLFNRQTVLIAALLLVAIFISSAALAQVPDSNQCGQASLAALDREPVPQEWNWFSVPLKINFSGGRANLVPVVPANNNQNYDNSTEKSFELPVAKAPSLLKPVISKSSLPKEPVPQEWDWFFGEQGGTQDSSHPRRISTEHSPDYQKNDNKAARSSTTGSNQPDADDKNNNFSAVSDNWEQAFEEAAPLDQTPALPCEEPVASATLMTSDPERIQSTTVAEPTEPASIVEQAVAPAEALQLAPGYIELKVRANGSSVKDPFFEVRMDQSEIVYLPLSEMFQILELKSFKMNQSEKIITGIIPGKEMNFLFNYATGELIGDAEPCVIGSTTYHISDSEVFMRADLFAKWLPLDLIWNVQTYQIYIKPNFELISQLIKKREALRKMMEERAAKKQYKILRANPVVFSPGTIRYQVKGGGEHDSFKLLKTSVAYLGPLAYGDFSGEIDIPAEKKAEMRFARLQYRNRYGMDEIMLGDTSVRQPDLIGGSKSIKGIRFASDESAWYGESDLRGYVDPGSEVELYQGSSLIDFQKAVNGEYRFTNLPLTRLPQ